MKKFFDISIDIKVKKNLKIKEIFLVAKEGMSVALKSNSDYKLALRKFKKAIRELEEVADINFIKK
jgi:hypothetical protein